MGALSLVSNSVFAGECETNFNTTRTSKGGLITNTMFPTPYPNPSDAIDAIKSVAKNRGFSTEPSLMKAHSSKERIITIKPPATSAKWLFFDISADPISIKVMSLSPKDYGVSGEEMRSIICGMMAQIKSDTPNTQTASTDHNGIDQSRGAPPSSAPKLNVLTPKTIFDVKAAQTALEPGTATITGTACSFGNAGTAGSVRALARGQSILLFPVTPYLEEMVDLMRKAKPGRDTVDVSKLALLTSITGVTNEQGQFQFTKMKPGRYYLLAQQSFDVSYSANKQVGHVQFSDGSTAGVYANETSRRSYDNVLEKFVEIKKPGEAVKVSLTTRPRLAVGGMAGVFGCK